MQQSATMVSISVCLLGLAGCGGGQGTTTTSASVEVGTDETAPSAEAFFCVTPIEAPQDVWARVESVRKLSDDVLTEKCGLPFVVAISEWCSVPVDLLQKIVSREVEDFDSLSRWVRAEASSHPRAVKAVVAMDLLSGFEIGGDVGVLAVNQKKWRDVALEVSVVKDVLDEARGMAELLTSLEEIHKKRCMLEVNPLGFAVSCKPIHPPRQKIDLHWKAETRDGLILNLELTRCEGSPSCKELRKVSREFLLLYLKTVDKMETLSAEVFKEQLREWLKLPPFA